MTSYQISRSTASIDKIDQALGFQNNREVNEIKIINIPREDVNDMAADCVTSPKISKPKNNYDSYFLL